MIQDLKAGTANHGFEASIIGHPPIRRVTGIIVLDEIKFGISNPLKYVPFFEWIVGLQRCNTRRTTQHGLDDHNIFGDEFADEIQSKERVAEVIQHTEKENDVKLFIKFT